jgi:prepilin-type N-terminal cleavage/methylation domain-containing protein
VSERGFTLIELLVASAAFAIVMLGMSSFYLLTVRVANEDTALTSIQHQATLVIDEMARQVGPATALEFPVACGADANGLRVTNSCGTFCFHRDGATGTQILEDRTLNGTCPNNVAGAATANLLSGALVPARGTAGLLSTVNEACGATTGGLCPSLVRHNGTNCLVGAAVTFRVRSQLPGTSSYQTMTFSSTFAGRNLPTPIPPAAVCP